MSNSHGSSFHEYNNISQLNVKLFADGADLAGMLEMYADPSIKGFTTNPTLMRKAGVTNYAEFAREVLARIPDRPISFEVLSDDFCEMEEQAFEIASWGKNVNVKIPVTNTKGEGSCDLIRKLSSQGVTVNVTAIMTINQVEKVAAALVGCTHAYVSVFAGGIADTGCDPIVIMRKAARILESNPNVELIWASPRELLNIFQADGVGCHIITATNDILKKLHIIGKPLEIYSQETVRMFFSDACQAGFFIQPSSGLLAKPA